MVGVNSVVGAVVAEAEDEVVIGVVKGKEEDKVVRLCIVGGKVEPEEKVDSVFCSSVVVVACMVVAVEEASVGCVGDTVWAAWVVMESVDAGLMVDASVVGFDAVLPGKACICSFSSRVDVSVTVAGVFFAVKARWISCVAVISEGRFVFIVVTVVSLTVTLGGVPAGSSSKGIDHLVIPAVTV